MHEYSILQSLLDGVKAQAEQHAAARVCVVHVSIGDASGVDAGLLATAFETLGTVGICAGAELRIKRVPARWACPKCGTATAPGTALQCFACQMPAQLASGDEIVLDRIEMEVSDV